MSERCLLVLSAHPGDFVWRCGGASRWPWLGTSGPGEVSAPRRVFPQVTKELA